MNVLGPAEAAICETFVVPRYLAFFGEAALELIEPEGEGMARVAHVHCRTGYPDRDLAARLPSYEIFGFDASPDAVELARSKGATTSSLFVDYRVFEGYPTSLPTGFFTHALSLHPGLDESERGRLFAEMARLLAPRGRAVLALPVRGAFGELADLFGEFVVKHGAHAQGVEAALARGAALHPPADVIATELVCAGLVEPRVVEHTKTLTFRGGSAFTDDAATRLLIAPEVLAGLSAVELARPLAHVREAIDAYFGREPFELTVRFAAIEARAR